MSGEAADVGCNPKYYHVRMQSASVCGQLMSQHSAGVKKSLLKRPHERGNIEAAPANVKKRMGRPRRLPVPAAGNYSSPIPDTVCILTYPISLFQCLIMCPTIQRLKCINLKQSEYASSCNLAHLTLHLRLAWQWPKSCQDTEALPKPLQPGLGDAHYLHLCLGERNVFSWWRFTTATWMLLTLWFTAEGNVQSKTSEQLGSYSSSKVTSPTLHLYIRNVDRPSSRVGTWSAKYRLGRLFFCMTSWT